MASLAMAVRTQILLRNLSFSISPSFAAVSFFLLCANGSNAAKIRMSGSRQPRFTSSAARLALSSP